MPFPLVFTVEKSRVVPTDIPGWLAEVLLQEQEEACSRSRALSDHGAEQIESYGTMNETIDIWRNGDFGWLIDWWDTDSQVMLITIADPAEYAMFQASWVAPMTLKILAADAFLQKTASQSDEEPAAVH